MTLRPDLSDLSPNSPARAPFFGVRFYVRNPSGNSIRSNSEGGSIVRYTLATLVSSLTLFAAAADGFGDSAFAGSPVNSKSPVVKKTVAPRTTTATRKNNKTAMNSTQIVHELEAARALLNKANHDYKGHRAAAVNQITHAIHILQHGKNHPNPSAHYTSGKGARNREDQKASDALLQQALAQMKTIAGQLHSTQHTKHHAQASMAVKKAIKDIMLSLKAA